MPDIGDFDAVPVIELFVKVGDSIKVDDAIAANPDVAERIRGGKVQAAGALIGQVMKEMKGQADAGRARELILASLGVDG